MTLLGIKALAIVVCCVGAPQLAIELVRPHSKWLDHNHEWLRVLVYFLSWLLVYFTVVSMLGHEDPLEVN